MTCTGCARVPACGQRRETVALKVDIGGRGAQRDRLAASRLDSDGEPGMRHQHARGRGRQGLALLPSSRRHSIRGRSGEVLRIDRGVDVPHWRPRETAGGGVRPDVYRVGGPADVGVVGHAVAAAPSLDPAFGVPKASGVHRAFATTQTERTPREAGSPAGSCGRRRSVDLAGPGHRDDAPESPRSLAVPADCGRPPIRPEPEDTRTASESWRTRCVSNP